jgi:ABC-type antimicrobial peptide transport system permease subunit
MPGPTALPAISPWQFLHELLPPRAVSYSILPRAALLTGVGAAVGVALGVGVGIGAGVADGDALGDGTGVGAGLGAGDADGEGDALGNGEALGAGDGEPTDTGGLLPSSVPPPQALRPINMASATALAYLVFKF